MNKMNNKVQSLLLLVLAVSCLASGESATKENDKILPSEATAPTLRGTDSRTSRALKRNGKGGGDSSCCGSAGLFDNAVEEGACCAPTGCEDTCVVDENMKCTESKGKGSKSMCVSNTLELRAADTELTPTAGSALPPECGTLTAGSNCYEVVDDVNCGNCTATDQKCLQCNVPAEISYCVYERNGVGYCGGECERTEYVLGVPTTTMTKCNNTIDLSTGETVVSSSCGAAFINGSGYYCMIA